MKNDLILIADDEPFNIDALEQELEDLGYRTISAKNGAEALKKVRTEQPDLLILDIMMPVMDGFEALKRLKADEQTEFIPVIVISAAADLQNMVAGIELGAEDYLPKPFNATLLQARIESSLERKHLRDVEKKYLKALQDEMNIAREIQRCFLPAALPECPGWEFEAWFESAKEVAGDFYDLFPTADGSIVFFVGDVCGKGVGAALFMTLFRSLLRMKCMEESETHEQMLLSAVRFSNEYISTVHEADNIFATLFIGVFQPGTGLVTYVNCGNEPAMLVGRDGQVCEEMGPTGPALGIFQEAIFNTRAGVLETGMALAAYTDGIPDAARLDGIPFGKDGIKTNVSGVPSTAIAMRNRLQTALHEFTNGAEAVDDITLVVISRM